MTERTWNKDKVFKAGERLCGYRRPLYEMSGNRAQCPVYELNNFPGPIGRLYLGLVAAVYRILLDRYPVHSESDHRTRTDIIRLL
jgi:hypothetical protein